MNELCAANEYDRETLTVYRTVSFSKVRRGFCRNFRKTLFNAVFGLRQVRWDPYGEADPSYHREGIEDSIKVPRGKISEYSPCKFTGGKHVSCVKGGKKNALGEDRRGGEGRQKKTRDARRSRGVRPSAGC